LESCAAQNRREPVAVSFDGLAERDRLHAVERRKIPVEHHLVAANEKNAPCSHFNGNKLVVGYRWRDAFL